MARRHRPVQVSFPRALLAPELISGQYGLAPGLGARSIPRIACNTVTAPRPLKSHERFQDSKGRQGIVMLAADRYRYGV